MGSDNGKLNRRSTRFGQWKAGSLSDGFRQWKAESQEYQVRTMESRIAEGTGQEMENLVAGVSDLDDGKPNLQRAQKALSTQSSNPEVSLLIFASAVTLM